MKTGRKIIMIVLAVLPLVMVLAVYNKLPEQVPMHWGINGEVDRYGEKSELFLLAGLNLFFGILLPLLARIDPKRRNYERFQETYDRIILWVLGFMAVIMALILVEIFRPDTVPISKTICGMVGILFIALGNMMPKVKRNYFTGVKTPWTLSSDTVWNKTHRLCGKLFVLGGFLMILGTFLFQGQGMFLLTILVILIIVFLPMVMSYRWYQKETEKDI